MHKTAVIYWSGTGNTEAMAMAVLEGAKEINPEAIVFNVSEISVSDALSYDTLILGCPAMGAEVLEEEEFEPFFHELENGLSGKNVALFGSYGWGDGEWMRDWTKRTALSGAKLVETEGFMINETPDAEGLALCRALGKKVASVSL